MCPSERDRPSDRELSEELGLTLEEVAALRRELRSRKAIDERVDRQIEQLDAEFEAVQAEVAQWTAREHEELRSRISRQLDTVRGEFNQADVDRCIGECLACVDCTGRQGMASADVLASIRAIIQREFELVRRRRLG